MVEKNWNDFIGDIGIGRNNLGAEMPVAVYRLFEFTMKNTLIEAYGEKEAIRLFRIAGYKAGLKFSNEMLNLNVEFNAFIADLQKILKDLKIGIFRLEQVNLEKKVFVVSIGEDLDCSGLPVTGETVCNYDEGFLEGIMKAYTNEDYIIRETDCWATGGRVCRFAIQQEE